MFRFKNLLLVGILLAAALMNEKCVYAGCTRNYGCLNSYNKYCCAKASTNYGYRDGVCRSSCLGEYCDYTSDCGGPDECCQSQACETCSISTISTGLASWIVAVIVISVLLVVAVPVGIVVCCCCCVASASSRPVHRGVVITGQQNPTTSVIAVQNSQMQSSAPAYIQNPPYGNQLQGYPPPGPPQQQKQGYPPPPAYNAHY